MAKKKSQCSPGSATSANSQGSSPVAATCPNCGYCPHCGRAAQPAVPYPYVPYYPPVPWYQRPWNDIPPYTITWMDTGTAPTLAPNATTSCITAFDPSIPFTYTPGLD